MSSPASSLRSRLNQMPGAIKYQKTETITVAALGDETHAALRTSVAAKLPAPFQYRGGLERIRKGDPMLTGDSPPYDFDRPAHVVFVAQHPNQMVPREEAPEGAGEIDLYDDKVQAGIAWTMRQWGETLGLTTWTQGDGSESVEGDVGAEIHTILCDAELRDPETNRMATLSAQEPATRIDANAILELAANTIEDHQKEGREWIKESLWDVLTREATGRIRALKTAPSQQPADDKLKAAVEAAEYACSLLPGLAGADDKPNNAVYSVMAAKVEIIEARRRLAALKSDGKT